MRLSFRPFFDRNVWLWTHAARNATFWCAASYRPTEPALDFLNDAVGPRLRVRTFRRSLSVPLCAAVVQSCALVGAELAPLQPIYLVPGFSFDAVTSVCVAPTLDLRPDQTLALHLSGHISKSKPGPVSGFLGLESGAGIFSKSRETRGVWSGATPFSEATSRGSPPGRRWWAPQMKSVPPVVNWQSPMLSSTF